MSDSEERIRAVAHIVSSAISARTTNINHDKEREAICSLIKETYAAFYDAQYSDSENEGD